MFLDVDGSGEPDSSNPSTVTDSNGDFTFSNLAAGNYTVDQVINIVCSATDALSGIDTKTCPGASGPAYLYPLGTTTLEANATDKAGNSSSGSTSFTVSVNFCATDDTLLLAVRVKL